VGEYPLPGSFIEACHRLSVLVGEADEEFVGEELDVAKALTKGRQEKLYDGKTIIQVFAEIVVASAFCKSRFVAATILMSTSISFLPPNA